MAALAVQNNNPGDLRYIGQPGAFPGAGGFAAFPNEATGTAALENDLSAKISGVPGGKLKPSSSLLDFASVYAPSSDGNDPVKYAQNLASQLGVSVTTPISSLSGRIHDFATAVAHNENSSTNALPMASSQPLASASLGGSQLTHSQMIANINAMEKQGAKPQEIQSYLDSLKGGQQTPQGNGYVTPPPPPPPIDTGTGGASPAPADPGFLSNEANSVTNRLAQGGQAISDAFSGKINPLSGVLQVIGAGAGGVNDLVGNVAGAITPDFIKKPVEAGIGSLVNAAANTGVGKSVIGGAQDFAQKNPELAGDIGAIGNIAGAAGLVTGGGEVADAAGGLLGRAVGKDALSATVDAISPEIKAGTVKGAANVAKSGTSKSVFGNISRNPDPLMTEAAPIVKENIPNFDKLPTFSDKLAAVTDKAIPNEAQALRAKLEAPDVKTIVNPDNYQGFLDKIDTAIKTSPSLIGDSGEYARRFLNVFKSNLPQGVDATPVQVLDARQALDREALQYKPNAFDVAKSSAYTDGLTAVRNAANQLIAEMAPDADVLTSLRRQSLLYKVAANLAPKADKEVGTGLLKRAMISHPRITRAAGAVGGSIGTGLGIKEGMNLFGGSSKSAP